MSWENIGLLSKGHRFESRSGWKNFSACPLLRVLRLALLYHDIIHMSKEDEQVKYIIFRKLDIEGALLNRKTSYELSVLTL